jgi:hypothetical protein
MLGITLVKLPQGKKIKLYYHHCEPNDHLFIFPNYWNYLQQIYHWVEIKV